MKLERVGWVLAVIGALGLMGAGGCVSDQPGGAIGLVQTGVDVVAEKYGAEGVVAEGRERLAEAEAYKVNRVLLPRDAAPSPKMFVDRDGVPYTNGVYEVQVWQVRRALANPVPGFVVPPPGTNWTQGTNGQTAGGGPGALP